MNLSVITLVVRGDHIEWKEFIRTENWGVKKVTLTDNSSLISAQRGEGCTVSPRDISEASFGTNMIGKRKAKKKGIK